MELDTKVNVIAGQKRKNREESDDEDEETVKKPRDLNVIGLEDSSESEIEDEIKVEIVESPAESQEQEEKIEKPDEIPEVPEVPKIKNEPEVPEKPVDRKPAVYIHVERDADIQIARLKLPILAEEQIIMETISENSVIILAGETGSGEC